VVISYLSKYIFNNVTLQKKQLVKRKNESDWIDPSLQNKDVLKSLLVPYDTTLMEAFSVSTEVNSPKKNH